MLFLPTRFGLGYMLPPRLCPSAGPDAFGHPGAGGSRADALVAALCRSLDA